MISQSAREPNCCGKTRCNIIITAGHNKIQVLSCIVHSMQPLLILNNINVFYLLSLLSRNVIYLEKNVKFSQIVNPLHPDISMYILHTVLYTLPKVLTRRICLAMKSFFSWWSFPLFSWPYSMIQGWYCKEKLDARSQRVNRAIWNQPLTT